MWENQEKFFYTFFMVNGDSFEIEIVEHPPFDLIVELLKSEKWLHHEDTIINLDNVNFIQIAAQISREEKSKSNISSIKIDF
ncbi:hypothetical protein HRF87_27640 [Bacillus sp. CRN 9]|nr:hypothetical protein [Bacillus sp. CRN 9]